MYTPNYPATVAEVLDPPVQFDSGTVAAVRRFASSKPFRGSVEDCKAKFAALHADLCRIHGRRTSLAFGEIDGTDSGRSHYQPTCDRVTVVGRLSIVTYLHEFAHALGEDERGAVRWSVNLFRLCFPRSFARCRADGHMLRANPAVKAVERRRR